MQVAEHCNAQASSPAQRWPHGLCCATALGVKEEPQELAAGLTAM